MSWTIFLLLILARRVLGVTASSLSSEESGDTFEHMAYVEVNSNSLSNVGCYVHSDTRKPYFNTASIFAGLGSNMTFRHQSLPSHERENKTFLPNL
jgi:hypothetical protein